MGWKEGRRSVVESRGRRRRAGWGRCGSGKVVPARSEGGPLNRTLFESEACRRGWPPLIVSVWSSVQAAPSSNSTRRRLTSMASTVAYQSCKQARDDCLKFAPRKTLASG